MKWLKMFNISWKCINVTLRIQNEFGPIMLRSKKDVHYHLSKNAFILDPFWWYVLSLLSISKWAEIYSVGTILLACIKSTKTATLYQKLEKNLNFPDLSNQSRWAYLFIFFSCHANLIGLWNYEFIVYTGKL